MNYADIDMCGPQRGPSSDFKNGAILKEIN